uniref:BESS domain-containing protein n=2 Tax=Loa loa TaxID=7209 RepID=A0A1I7VSB1_LOALO
MDDDDEMMDLIDTELLSSEEEFGYTTIPQPSTSFFNTPPNLFFTSCQLSDLFLQQFPSLQMPQSMNELALQYLTAPLIQLTGNEILLEPELISSEYSKIITSLSAQSINEAFHP